MPQLLESRERLAAAKELASELREGRAWFTSQGVELLGSFEAAQHCAHTLANRIRQIGYFVPVGAPLGDSVQRLLQE